MGQSVWGNGRRRRMSGCEWRGCVARPNGARWQRSRALPSCFSHSTLCDCCVCAADADAAAAKAGAHSQGPRACSARRSDGSGGSQRCGSSSRSRRSRSPRAPPPPLRSAAATAAPHGWLQCAARRRRAVAPHRHRLLLGAAAAAAVADAAAGGRAACTSHPRAVPPPSHGRPGLPLQVSKGGLRGPWPASGYVQATPGITAVVRGQPLRRVHAPNFTHRLPPSLPVPGRLCPSAWRPPLQQCAAPVQACAVPGGSAGGPHGSHRCRQQHRRPGAAARAAPGQAAASSAGGARGASRGVCLGAFALVVCLGSFALGCLPGPGVVRPTCPALPRPGAQLLW